MTGRPGLCKGWEGAAATKTLRAVEHRPSCAPHEAETRQETGHRPQLPASEPHRPRGPLTTLPQEQSTRPEALRKPALSPSLSSRSKSAQVKPAFASTARVPAGRTRWFWEINAEVRAPNRCTEEAGRERGTPLFSTPSSPQTATSPPPFALGPLPLPRACSLGQIPHAVLSTHDRFVAELGPEDRHHAPLIGSQVMVAQAPSCGVGGAVRVSQQPSWEF